MKTFQQFQQDLQEFAPALAPLAPYVLPAVGAAVYGMKGYLEARKQGQGGRSQPVDYGQGGEGSKPRSQSTVRPAGPRADYKARLKAQQQARRAEVEANREERAQQGIEQILGTDAERKAAAQARANQPQIQRDLRRQATRDRMNQAADRLGLPEQIAPGKPMLPNARDQVIVDPQSPGQKLRNLQLKVKYYGGYPPKGPV